MNFNIKGSFFKKLRIYFPVLLPLYMALIPLILGGNNIYRIHDQLDSVGPLAALIDSGEFFKLDPNYIVNNIINGIPRSFLGSPFNICWLIFYFFGILNGLIINNFLIRLIGFGGMYLLLKIYILTDEKYQFIVIIVCSVFSSIPIFELFGLGSLGFPLLTYATLEFYHKRNYLQNSLFIMLFCFYSYFFHTGLFYIGILGLITLFITTKEKKINWGLLSVMLIMTIFYCLVEYQTISNFLHPTTNISHRFEFNIRAKNKPLSEVLLNTFTKATQGNYHSGIYEGLSIIIIAFFSIAINYYKKANLKLPLLLVTTLFLIAFTSEIFDWGKFKYVYELIPITKNFNFSRIDFFLVFLIYILLSVSLKIISDNTKNKSYLLILFSIIGFYLLIQNLNLRNAFRNDALSKNISFNNYFAFNLWEKINKKINFKKSDFRIIHIGIDPGITMVNNGKTLDGYFNSYPLKYKKEFRKIIEAELDDPEMNLKNKKKFDNWGNRCYVFYHNKPVNNVLNIKLNSFQLKKMNCKYVFSAFSLENLNENKLRLINTFIDNTTAVKSVYVYEVL